MVTCHLVLNYFPHLVIQNGLTALDLASFSDHHQIVQLLLRAGANPDLQDEVRMEVYLVKQRAKLREVATVQIRISSDIIFGTGTTTVKKAFETPYQDKTTEIESA